MPALSLTESDNGQSFNLRIGDQIFIRLEESPTTGYQWAVDQIGELLVLESSDFFPAAASIGTGGERILSFTARGAGSTRLSLKLKREWEDDSSAIKRFGVELNVNES